MENYPQELAQDAVCQSNTGHMTGLWFLPTRPLRLNTNEWKNESVQAISTFFIFLISHFRRVLNDVCFLLGNYLASEFLCRRFRTPCLFHLHGQVGVKNDWGRECWCTYTGKLLARKFSNQTFSHINTPTFLKTSHSSYLPAYEDGTDRVFRNVSI